MGLLQISPVRKQYLHDSMDYLSSAGQAALKDIEKAKLRRARDKSTAELKAILDRVALALDEFATAQAELEIPESPPAAEEKKRKKKRRKSGGESGSGAGESGGLGASADGTGDDQASVSECSDSEGSGSEEGTEEESRPVQPWEKQKQKLSREMLRKVSSRTHRKCVNLRSGPSFSPGP